MKNILRIGLVLGCVHNVCFGTQDVNNTQESVTSCQKATKLWEKENLSDIVLTTDRQQNMENYLKAGHSTNLVDPQKNRTSLLQYYAQFGNIDMFNLTLAQKDVWIGYYDDLRQNVLHKACLGLRPDHRLKIINSIIQYCQEKKPSLFQEILNWPDQDGFTPLHIASHRGYVDIVQTLLENHGVVDALAHGQTTALHLAAGNGHGPVIQLLLDYHADKTKAHCSQLMAKDFYRLYESKTNKRLNPALIKALTPPLPPQYQDVVKEYINSHPVLNVFKETFQRRCSSIFLAYKTLESGAIEGTKDALSASNVLNILGSITPLPGAGLVAEVASYVCGEIENRIEEEKKAAMTTFFLRVDTMENAVEQAAYDLTDVYKNYIEKLTEDGAEILSLCALGRFVDYMRRADVVIDKTKPLGEYVLTSVKEVRPLTLLEKLPRTHWTYKTIEKAVETHSAWTERSIFENTLSFADSMQTENANMQIYPVVISSLTVVEQVDGIATVPHVEFKPRRLWFCCC